MERKGVGTWRICLGDLRPSRLLPPTREIGTLDVRGEA